MSTLVEDIQAVMAGLNLAGGAWFGFNTTEPPVFPYVAWLRVVSVANVTLDTPSERMSDLQNTRIQVDVFSQRATEADAIAKLVTQRLLQSGLDVIPGASQDIWEDTIRVYRISTDYSIWARN